MRLVRYLGFIGGGVSHADVYESWHGRQTNKITFNKTSPPHPVVSHTHKHTHGLILKKSRLCLNTQPLRRFHATKGFSLVICRREAALNEEANNPDTSGNKHRRTFLFFPGGLKKVV